jgi:hypothetical protein
MCSTSREFLLVSVSVRIGEWLSLDTCRVFVQSRITLPTTPYNFVLIGSEGNYRQVVVMDHSFEKQTEQIILKQIDYRYVPFGLCFLYRSH